MSHFMLIYIRINFQKKFLDFVFFYQGSLFGPIFFLFRARKFLARPRKNNLGLWAARPESLPLHQIGKFLVFFSAKIR